jgi:hypothetical protein
MTKFDGAADLETDPVMFRRNRGESFFFVSEGEHWAAGMRQHSVNGAIVGEVVEYRAMRGTQHKEIRAEID